MGGMGSGRQARDDSETKQTTTMYQQIHVRLWQRDGLLKPGSSTSHEWKRNNQTIKGYFASVEADYVTFFYGYWKGGKWQTSDCRISIERTGCHYGGSRVWFRCPIASCGRRVAILYFGAGLACRHCLQLAYPSQRKTDGYRGLERAQTIRTRLGGSPDLMKPFPKKPKGMHLKTYMQLEQEATRAKDRFFAALSKQLRRYRDCIQ